MSSEKRKADKAKTKAARAADAPKVEKVSEASAEKSATASLETAEQELPASAETGSATATKDREKDKRAEKAARNADPLETLAEKYAKAYPDCRAFHITTDRQVFLEKDENLANYHQKGLGGGEVRTIKVR